MSRMKQRQEMLRELASNETFCVLSDSGHSRAKEAVEAMRRIREGTYGTCVDCDGRIPA